MVQMPNSSANLQLKIKVKPKNMKVSFTKHAVGFYGNKRAPKDNKGSFRSYD